MGKGDQGDHDRLRVPKIMGFRPQRGKGDRKNIGGGGGGGGGGTNGQRVWVC